MLRFTIVGSVRPLVTEVLSVPGGLEEAKKIAEEKIRAGWRRVEIRHRDLRKIS